jgi:hypothetical protein
MNIQDIINNIAAGENLVAKEGLENALSAKAFDALQDRKQEIASALYAGPEQESEEDTDYEEDEEVTYAEGVEYDEDQDQLDEVSMKLASSVYKNRKLDAEDDSAGHSSGSGQKRSDSYTKSGKHKMNISRDKIMSKPGGAQRVRRIDAITEEGEHLDEVSLDAAAKVYKKRADNAYSNQSNSNVDKQVKSREVIGKRFGLKGKQMAKGIEKKYDNYSQ